MDWEDWIDLENANDEVEFMFNVDLMDLDVRMQEGEEAVGQVEEAIAVPRFRRADLTRPDRINMMSDRDFKANFRMSKICAQRLADMLDPVICHPTNRSNALTPLNQVLILLNILGGGHFMRTTALIGNVTSSTVFEVMKRVMVAINNLKPQFLKMPTEEEMAETAARMETRFHLPGFAFAVDGVMANFREKPQRIPHGLPAQRCWQRKQRYSINCQVIGNDSKKILDIDVGWPGSANSPIFFTTTDILIK